MEKVKQIEIKNWTYYFYNDMIDLKNFENLLKQDKKYYKGINIYYIGYITIKKVDDCENIYNVYPLSLIVNHASDHKWVRKDTNKRIWVWVNKKEFHKSKQPIDLDLINVDQIVVSDKFKHSDDGFNYLIGWKEGEIVKPLCIILPQMSGYIKYFENGGQKMSFVIKNDDVLDKYNKIWDNIKTDLNITFHSMPVYDEKYIKAKVRKFNDVIKTKILGDKMPKENAHYTCIACKTIDSVMRIEKKNYAQVYLEECKYKMKKTKMTKLINTKLESESESESEPDIELELNSELESE